MDRTVYIVTETKLTERGVNLEILGVFDSKEKATKLKDGMTGLQGINCEVLPFVIE